MDEDAALASLVKALRLEAHEDALRDELTALQAIYGALRSFTPSRPPSIVDGSAADAKDKRYFSVETSLPDDPDVLFTILVTLDPTYPAVAPQLQLQSVYVGDYAVDYKLFGEILRIFMRDDEELAGGEKLFDGLERAREVVGRWHEDKVKEKPPPRAPSPKAPSRSHSPPIAIEPVPAQRSSPSLKIAASEPIIDRKSVFVGWAARIDEPDQIDALMAQLLTDKKVARATHNILAWRCRTADGVLHQDNDDDGESAAGARLAHLLDILKCDNVAVVVSRWYGGIHLGSDRFKHINSAARAALEAGGFLHDNETTKTKSGRKH